MIQVPAEILALSAEAALLVKNGRIVYSNAAADRLFGCVCTEQPLRKLLGEELCEVQAASYVGETLRSGRRYLLQVQSMDGMRLYLFREAESTTDGMGETFLLALRGSLMELRVSNALLQDRVEKLGTDALTGPLNSINCGFFRLNRILTNVTVLHSAANDSLTPELQLLDLGPYLKDLCDSVSALVKGPELRLRVSEGAVVPADPALLEILLLNLLSNAFRHAEGCTRISLSVHTTADRAIVSVDDDGCGIPPEGLRTVFDRFRCRMELSEMANGAGFGLSAAREIARAHGGVLLLESRVGSGTAVRFSLSRDDGRRLSLREEGQPYEQSANSLLTGLADCLPAEAFRASNL